MLLEGRRREEPQRQPAKGVNSAGLSNDFADMDSRNCCLLLPFQEQPIRWQVLKVKTVQAGNLLTCTGLQKKPCAYACVFLLIKCNKLNYLGNKWLEAKRVQQSTCKGLRILVCSRCRRERGLHKVSSGRAARDLLPGLPGAGCWWCLTSTASLLSYLFSKGHDFSLPFFTLLSQIQQRWTIGVELCILVTLKEILCIG